MSEPDARIDAAHAAAPSHAASASAVRHAAQSVTQRAAQRQAQLRALAALQRDALDLRWQQLAPAFERADTLLDRLSRLRRLREHPLALALLAASTSGLLLTRRGRRLAGLLRTGWRLGLRAATLLSLWKAVRSVAPRRQGDGAPARYRITDAAASRVSADARSAAPDAPSRPPAGAPDRPA